MNLARSAAFLLFALLFVPHVFGYSVLTHEEIVDLVWTSHIQPLLLARYPGLTPDELIEAHAYAYGGSVVQDLGYYPFGSKEFSDLVHYVRTGDFVVELLHQSKDAKEYAFALGAMAHYVSDVDGHPAVNQAVALRYPKLRARFGWLVTYADDKSAHLKTEFGFDVSQVAKHRYAPKDYHDFIGFEVSEPLLERVFPIVYGMDLKDALPHEELAVGSYRWAVSRLIPHMTKVALQIHGKEMAKESPNFERRKFLYRLSRTDYEKAWGRKYEHAGFGTRFMAVLLSIVPKVGPFKGLAFNEPTKQTEDLYIKSINKTVDDYQKLLDALKTQVPQLPSRDLDTGHPTKAAEYSLADDTYAKLLKQLADRKFDRATPELRSNLAQFYSGSREKMKSKQDEAKWQRISTALQQLKSAPAAATVSSGTE